MFSVGRVGVPDAVIVMLGLVCRGNRAHSPRDGGGLLRVLSLHCNAVNGPTFFFYSVRCVHVLRRSGVGTCVWRS